ncbi:MAG: leukotoxin LktA family filamentous adhesin, partial [Selenomonadaceae bacterium]|nr:leukotoxin LktA family filamentous adhesin [Selenomonadaceae bacterium]
MGVNEFKDFTLDQGQIANIQFGKLQSLANLVDNKISINGTVNALRDGKIGGNLYFLSPNGIAVGASGVINAGAFTGMAVDRDYFDKLGGIGSANEFMVQLAPKNIVYNNDPDRGIDIQGVINAPGGISLYASKIDIGSGAVLRTNVDKVGDLEKVDFTKVVNVEGVDSGITGGLDASYKNGDIILQAHAEHIADDNSFSGDASTKFEKITERTATINVDGKLFSANDVSINADSKISFTEGSYFNVLSQSGMLDAILGSLGIDVSVDWAKKDNAATVNINKTANIISKGNMDIAAKAEMEVSISAKTPAKMGTTKATDWIPATAVSVISATNKATVNVDGKLTSGGRMAINADASASLSGTAEAKTAVATAAQKKGLKEDPMYIGVSVIVGENNAEVNINSGEKITAGGEDVIKDSEITTHGFEANATVTNSVSSSAAAANVKPGSSKGSDIANSARDDAAVNTVVNVVNYTDKAIVNVNRDIEATNGSIGLKATNDIENSLSASTTVGKEIFPMNNPFFRDAPDFLNSLSGNLATWLTSGFQKNLDAVPNEAGGSTLSKIFNGEYLKTGIAVGVFEQDNTAKVNVGSSATLTAKNNIDLNAKTEISSLGLSVDSTVNNQSKNQKTNAMIGLGVLVSDINNDADAVIGGKLINTDASGTVNVKTDSGMDYNQFYKVTDDIRDAFIKVGKDMADLYDKLGTPFEDYNEQVETELKNLENSDDPDEYMSNLSKLNEKINDTHSTGLDAAIENLEDTVAIKQELEALPSTLLSILSPSSYANYYALSAFYANTDKSKADSSKIDAAGAFSINNMTNNSRIALNKSAAITAKGNVDLSTLAKNRVVAITGMGGPHLTSSEANNKGAGISVKVGKFDNNSLIAVGDKAQISGKDVKLATDENSRHVNAAELAYIQQD